MKHITDNIYSFTLPLPFQSTANLTLYFIDDDKQTLIDTGLGDQESIQKISSELQQIGRKIENISCIINTHEHIEHFGGNKKLKEISGANIICSDNAAFKIENSQKINNKLKYKLSEYEPVLAEKLMREIDFDLNIDECKVDRLIKDREIIDLGKTKLQVISTPGHSAGHICLYYSDKKQLFTGDHILSTGSTFVGYDYREIASQNIVDIYNLNYNKPDNLSMYLNSLKICHEMDIEMLLPSHGEPVATPYKKIYREMQKKERRALMFMNVLEKHDEISLTDLTLKVYGKNSDDFLHKGSALGYLARLNKKGEIRAEMRKNDLYLTLMRN